MNRLVRRLSKDGVIFSQDSEDIYYFFASGICETEGPQDYIQKYVEDVAHDWEDNTVVLLWQEFLELPCRGCVHDWKHYVGFTEVYHFCQKCDVKRI